jgi:hypothetical protein
MSFELINRPTTCTGVHRSGWPYVMQYIKPYAVEQGDILFDDFVEHSFVYQPNRPHKRPWVGVFHHPATVKSPLRKDIVGNNLKHTMERSRPSLKHLKGCIVLNESSVPVIRQYTKAPIIVLKHPTETPSRYWQFMPRAWQVGFFLRDTRLMHRAPIFNGWERSRSTPWMTWMSYRDNALRKTCKNKEQFVPDEIPRLDNDEYDQRMASSVVYTRLYGAAANNVVVECVARHTPIVVNRLRDVEWYLGKDYPLYYQGNTPEVITQEQAEAASRYLKDLAADSSWLRGEVFASNILTFLEEICCGKTTIRRTH